MKAAVLISTGLGNAIMLVPAINALRKAGYEVDGIFTSPYRCEELFEDSPILEEKIGLASKSQILSYGLKNRLNYDVVVLDQFACTKKHFWLAKIIGKRIFAQTADVTSIKKKIVYVPYISGNHGVMENLRLIQEVTDSQELNYRFIEPQKRANYVVFQPGSGNNKTPWKNWSLNNWIKVLANVKMPIKVIGDHNERSLIPELKKLNHPNMDILIGEQSIGDMVKTIASAKAYLGHDSGPMHISVACNIPTFVIWGGSPKSDYAYDDILPDKNMVIQGKAKYLSDEMIKELSPKYVEQQLQAFLNDL